MPARLDRIVLNHQGFHDMLTGGPVVDLVGKVVDAIAADAGDGYDGSVIVGKTRARGSVITASYEARAENARHNTLLRALDAGRRL